LRAARAHGRLANVDALAVDAGLAVCARHVFTTRLDAKPVRTALLVRRATGARAKPDAHAAIADRPGSALHAGARRDATSVDAVLTDRADDAATRIHAVSATANLPGGTLDPGAVRIHAIPVVADEPRIALKLPGVAASYAGAVHADLVHRAKIAVVDLAVAVVVDVVTDFGFLFDLLFAHGRATAHHLALREPGRAAAYLSRNRAG
jgi:hypothetical protein